METKERIQQIREGNRLFNEGISESSDEKIYKAKEIYVHTHYIDGLLRTADYYYYDKRLPLMAISLYKQARAKEKISEIHQRMIFALRQWIHEDDAPDNRSPASLTTRDAHTPLPEPSPTTLPVSTNKNNILQEPNSTAKITEK